jgi:hypothetical protein
MVAMVLVATCGIGALRRLCDMRCDSKYGRYNVMSFEMPLTRPRMGRKEERKIGKIDNGDGTDEEDRREVRRPRIEWQHSPPRTNLNMELGTWCELFITR